MRHKIPIEIIELESENYHLIISSVFSDGTKGNWVIDTGASKTVFDKNLKAHFLLSDEKPDELHSASVSEEPLETSIGYLNPFSFQKLKVENMKVALLDMSHINTLYSKVCNLEICGLIGSDFLLSHKAIIDYKKKRLVLRGLL